MSVTCDFAGDYPAPYMHNTWSEHDHERGNGRASISGADSRRAGFVSGRVPAGDRPNAQRWKRQCVRAANPDLSSGLMAGAWRCWTALLGLTLAPGGDISPASGPRGR